MTLTQTQEPVEPSDVRELGQHGGDRKSEKARNQVGNVTNLIGNTVAQIVARLGSALKENLEWAVEFIEELDQHKCWEWYGLDRTTFYQRHANLEADHIDEIKAEVKHLVQLGRPVPNDVRKLRSKPGRPKKDEKNDSNDGINIRGGNNRLYTLARLDRDRPALAAVISLNAKRRHLTSKDRAIIAVESLPLYEAEAAERQRATLKQYANKTTVPQKVGERTDQDEPTAAKKTKSHEGEAVAQAAKAAGTNRESVRQAKRVKTAAQRVASTLT